MKKTIYMLILGLIIFSMAVFAQTASEKMIAPMPPVPGGDVNAFGQNHFYSVIFDGEGEAIVAAKLKVQNTGKENISEMQIEIPGKSVRIVNMMQEVQKKEKKCSYWEKVCVSYDKETDTCNEFKDKCSNWYVQDIWPPFYYTINRTSEQLSKSVKYSLELPSPIAEQETGTILIYYKVEGYADKTLGAYDFDFETIKLNQDVNQVRVAVNVIEGLYMKGGKANVDYRSGFSVMEKAAPAMSADGVQSQDLQQFSSQIEWQDGYVKTTQGLDPWESFHVKGKYATSWLMLHKLGILIALVVFIAIIGGIVMAFKKIMSSKKESLLALFGIGTGAAILLILTWVFLGYIMDKVGIWIGWQYSALISLMMVLLGVIMTLALLFGPAIYIGITKGAKNGLIVFGIEIAMLLVLSIIVVIILAVLNQSPPPVIYSRAMESVAVD